MRFASVRPENRSYKTIANISVSLLLIANRPAVCVERCLYSKHFTLAMYILYFGNCICLFEYIRQVHNFDQVHQTHLIDYTMKSELHNQRNTIETILKLLIGLQFP